MNASILKLNQFKDQNKKDFFRDQVYANKAKASPILPLNATHRAMDEVYDEMD